MADELKIGIKVTADTAAAKQAETAIAEVTKATENTAAAAEKTTEALQQLGTAAEQTGTQAEAGAVKTEEAVKKVGSTAESLAKSFAEANATSAEFGNTLGSLNNEQLLEVEDALRADIKATEDLGKSTDDLKRKLQETYELRTSETFQKTASGVESFGKAARTASGELQGLQRQSKAVGDVVIGLETASRGGIGGLLGLGRAAKGAGELMRGAFSGVAGVLTVVAAGLGAVKLILDGIASRADAGLVRAFKDVGKETENLKKKSAELEAQFAKDLASQREKVAALTSAYADLVSRQDKAFARSKELGDATISANKAAVDKEEAQALAAAKTPEQKERIKADFADKRERTELFQQNNALNSSDDQAKLNLRNAEEARSAIRAEIDEADLELAKKRSAAADAKSLAVDAGKEALATGGKEDAGSRAIQQAARAQAAAAALAEKEVAAAEKKRADLDGKFAGPAAAEDEAKQTLRVNEQKRKQLQTETETRDIQRGEENKAKIKELSEQAAQQQLDQDFGGLDKSVAEINRLKNATPLADVLTPSSPSNPSRGTPGGPRIKEEKRGIFDVKKAGAPLTPGGRLDGKGEGNAEELQKLEEENTKKEEERQKVKEEDGQKIADISEQVSNTETPPPLDPTPITDANGKYHAKVVEMQGQNQQAITSVATEVDGHTRQIELLTRQIQALAARPK